MFPIQSSFQEETGFNQPKMTDFNKPSITFSSKMPGKGNMVYWLCDDIHRGIKVVAKTLSGIDSHFLFYSVRTLFLFATTTKHHTSLSISLTESSQMRDLYLFLRSAEKHRLIGLHENVVNVIDFEIEKGLSEVTNILIIKA